MTTTAARTQEIQRFGERYRYDMSYQHLLLESSPEAFEVFARAQGTSSHRRHLSLEAHYVARVAMMVAEDCGDCIQVNLRMAVEAGVDRGLLEALLWHPEELSPELRDVRDHALQVSAGPHLDAARVRRLNEIYGAAGFAELGVCLAGCRLFTTLKRSLGKASPREIQAEDF